MVVVSPADFRHFGIAYGGGIVQNLRAKPWLVAALPLFLAGFARAARRAARTADVVHAHWIPSASRRSRPGSRSCSRCGAPTSSSPAAPRGSCGRSLRRARVVIAASAFLGRGGAALGAREVRVIPTGVEIPAEVGEPDEPPHVLFVGRLSEEKGILEFLGGDGGPAAGDRRRRPAARPGAGGGRLRPARRARRRTTSGRRSSACRRGGRATAWWRARRWRTGGRWSRRRSAGSPTRSRTGSPGCSSRRGDPHGLGDALRRLLADGGERRRLGAAGRRFAEERWGVHAATQALLRVYEGGMRD